MTIHKHTLINTTFLNKEKKVINYNDINNINDANKLDFNNHNYFFELNEDLQIPLIDNVNINFEEGAVHLLSTNEDSLLNLFILSHSHSFELLSIDHSVEFDLFVERHEKSKHYPIRVLHVNPEIKVYYTIINNNRLDGMIITRKNEYSLLADVNFGEVEEMMDSLEVFFNNLEDKNYNKKVLHELQSNSTYYNLYKNVVVKIPTDYQVFKDLIISKHMSYDLVLIEKETLQSLSNINKSNYIALSLTYDPDRDLVSKEKYVLLKNNYARKYSKKEIIEVKSRYYNAIIYLNINKNMSVGFLEIDNLCYNVVINNPKHSLKFKAQYIDWIKNIKHKELIKSINN